MKDLTEKLKETVENATDAETAAIDVLSTINYRAKQIKDSRVIAQQMLDDTDDIKVAVDATRKGMCFMSRHTFQSFAP